MTAPVRNDARIRQVIPAMRWLLTIAGLLVLGAGNSLFIFSEQTDEYFAWTIDNPLTAAFLGAAFWSSCALELISARERVWSRARLAVPSVLAFTILTLIATLLHLDLFHDSWLAWAWVAIYLIVPPVFLVVLWMQLQEPGIDEPRHFPLPAWLRGLSIVQGIVLIFVGEGLMLAPNDAMTLWPWPLTELTARAIGAWLIGLGIIAVQAAWENDYLRVRASGFAAILLATLQAVALARYPDTVDLGSTEAIAYMFALVVVAVVGVGSVLGNQRANRESPGTIATTTSEA